MHALQAVLIALSPFSAHCGAAVHNDSLLFFVKTADLLLFVFVHMKRRASHASALQDGRSGLAHLFIGTKHLAFRA